MSKGEFDRYVDGEGTTHFTGASLVVNAGLCGNNDYRQDAEGLVNCAGCIAVLRHVYAHRRPLEAA